jgi:alpha-tubulin suppressor-like RCC1 family protein
LYVTSDGKLYAMGSNSSGQLGLPVFPWFRTTPTPVLVIAGVGAPTITAHPASQTITIGGNVTFSVFASGENLSYQWIRNGANITGATGSSYTITNVQQAHAGSYTVRVTNPVGFSSSNVAMLTVDGGSSGDGNGNGNNNNSGGAGSGGGGASSLLCFGAVAALLALRNTKRLLQQ